jgi:RNA polymerase sigma-70 factor (ECF subfamily)
MDLPAIEELYARYGAMVRRRARAILGEEQSALDAMQEVFVRALSERESYRGDASPVTWLYRITTNLCLNRVRDRARQRHRRFALAQRHRKEREHGGDGGH